MQPASDHPAILPHDLPVGQVVGMSLSSGVVLICEHASAFIPPSLGDLGLDLAGRVSHAAWDIGALDVAREMGAVLGAPLVAANVSRLVYDCNRPPDANSAMPARSERFDVPGNARLSLQEKAARVAEIYEPFEALVADVIARQEEPPALVTVHTFTPVYHGQQRETEIGLLHDENPELAQRMLEQAAAHTDLRVELNKPYDRSDGVTHTLARHGTENALPNVMIEVRNDLVSTPQTAKAVGRALAGMLTDSLRGRG